MAKIKKKAPAAKKILTAVPQKKKPVAKVQSKTDTLSWNVLHVFGYGETQIIGPEVNGKILNNGLKSIEPLFAHLASLQQKGTKVTLKDLHMLNILREVSIEYKPRSEKNKPQLFTWADVDKKLVTTLVKEVSKKIPEATKNKKVVVKHKTLHSAK